MCAVVPTVSRPMSQADRLMTRTAAKANRACIDVGIPSGPGVLTDVVQVGPSCPSGYDGGADPVFMDRARWRDRKAVTGESQCPAGRPGDGTVACDAARAPDRAGYGRTGLRRRARAVAPSPRP